MFSGMTSAEQLGAICLVILIAAPVLGLLGVAGAVRYALVAAPSEQSFREWLDSHLAVDEPAPPAPSYREPADERLVDALAVAFAKPAAASPTALAIELSEIVHSFDTQTVDIEPEPLGHVADELADELHGSHYRVTLADLVEGSRYVVPIKARAVSTEPRQPSHCSGTIDTTKTQTIGRHRAPITATPARRELVAA